MRTDPRIDRSRTAVLQATADLRLEAGCEKITIDQTAERSGVTRSLGQILRSLVGAGWQ